MPVPSTLSRGVAAHSIPLTPAPSTEIAAHKAAPRLHDALLHVDPHELVSESASLPDLPDEPKWGRAVGIMLALSLLLKAPALLFGTLPVPASSYDLPDPTRLYYLFSLDLFGLFFLLSLVPYRAGRSPLRLFVAGSCLFLLGYEVYDAAVQGLLHRSPIFYADAPHLLGAGYLLLNADMPLWHVVGLCTALGVLALLAWGLPALLRFLHHSLRRPPLQYGMFGAAAVVGTVVVAAVVGDWGIERRTYQAPCLSTTECVVRNIQASAALRRDVRHRSSTPADSTYVEFQRRRWSRPPSLYVVVLESYGAVLTSPPHRETYNGFMGPIADSLRASNWRMATAHSRAPVSGGLSWLSVASVLLGTNVKHQPTFDVLRSTLPRYPHLVRLLRQHGYETATLQPPVRNRPGLSVDNLYGFDRTFYFADLEYEGPSFGWGIVPDQYSLAVAHDRFVERTHPPFFLFFEAVTAHAPWQRPPPPIVDDPAALSNRRRSSGPPAPTDAPTGASAVGQLLRHVRYDWRVLSDYLQGKAPANSLVVVLGDHQPPGGDHSSLATPIHVLSRDERLVQRFEAYGFSPGLRPAPASDTLHHAGVYSMIARTLTAHSAVGADSSVALPPYRPHGVERAALLPTR